jgi:hypothetical protein
MQHLVRTRGEKKYRILEAGVGPIYTVLMYIIPCCRKKVKNARDAGITISPKMGQSYGLQWKNPRPFHHH